MCTVTWSASPSGYHLFMNRDELSTRGEAIPPSVHREGDVSYVAPIDSDAGGTWIAANEHGVTVCLLNYFPPGFSWSSGEEYTSRGKLVTDLIAHRSAAEVTAALLRMDVTRYRPFTLFTMGGGSVPRRHRWNGSGFLETRDAPAPPLASSGFDRDAVIAARTTTYSQIVGDQPTPELLARYHRSHLPERGPYSVCAHRDDGGSRSLTHVNVDENRIVLEYTAGPPCEGGETCSAEIARDANSGYDRER
ncbi:MAG: NRDE family protein [Spirochaetota bacterium]